MRAESGKPLSRPLGSPIVLSRWETLLFNPVHLAPRLPTQDGVVIQTGVTIGPRAKKPLHLEIPILITGMSYGGALGMKQKIALARAATMAGTATNSGEAPLIPEERQAAKYFIGQYNRGGWMNTPEQLRQLDAIEIQLGQGAQAAAPMGTASWQIDDPFRKHFRIPPGEDTVIHTRLPGVNRPADFVHLVRELRATYGVPVGLKTCATHYLERELDIALEGEIDFVVVDGAEGGTHGGPTILQDDVGLPTLIALARTVRHLERRGVKRDVSVIAAGGLTTPGHFLKAMAFGADAVYIGSIALVAMLHTQMNLATPFEPPVQAALYHGKFKEDFDIEQGAEHLAKFLKSCVEEMKLVAYALGKTDLNQISRDDLVCVDKELARVLGVDYAGYPREEQHLAWTDASRTWDGAPKVGAITQEGEAVAAQASGDAATPSELCSLTFVPQDRSKRNLIATALFADGAAAVLVGGDAAAPAQGNPAPHPAIVGRASVTWPNTLDVIGWDLTDDGLNVVFSPAIPELVRRNMPEFARGFLARFGLTPQDLRHILAHPGGAKVLDALQEALGVPPHALHDAAEILAEYGNVSAATVLFVLARRLNRPWPAGEPALVTALGPGFSGELVLLCG